MTKELSQKAGVLAERVCAHWEGDALDELKAYVRLPSKSKDFDPDWEKNGYLRQALERAAAWGRTLFGEGNFEVLTEPGKTPALFFELPATGGHEGPAVYFYGHLDKQPEGKGWGENRHPFEPVVEGESLYGRGAADDGYNFYAAMTAVKSLQEAGVPHARVVGLYETDEECGSRDFEFWMDRCRERFGEVGLVVVMDCGAADYEHFWISTSFRGALSMRLTVQVLEHGVHSGMYSGIAPSSFMISRALLERIEDSTTGEMSDAALNVAIPQERLAQMRRWAEVVGEKIYEDLPWVCGTQPRSRDVFETVVMNTWKPQLCVTGADGIPAVEQAGNVLRAGTTLKLSVRLPPTASAETALARITERLTADPLFGCRVTVDHAHGESGWNAPDQKESLTQAIDRACAQIFGSAPVYCGCGGSIGILPLFNRYFPHAQFLLTGVLGPHSNAHGPDEMLRLDYLKKVTQVVAQVTACV